MAKINTKLYGDQYQSLDDFMSDFQLMFDNACRYNEPDSQVYKVRQSVFVCIQGVPHAITINSNIFSCFTL